jgi:hypothetical protein
MYNPKKIRELLKDIYNNKQKYELKLLKEQQNKKKFSNKINKHNFKG